MGWFSCYGSREKEDKRTHESSNRGPEHGNGIRSKHHQQQQEQQEQQHQAATNRAVKHHGENVKPVVSIDYAKLVAPVDDTHKEAPASGLQESTPDSTAAVQNIPAQTFTFKQLAVAAEYFRDECLIGEGGFGSVYRGCLENGQVVAIKQLNRNGLQGNREFLVEVLMLSLLHHENLVNLIGYCADGDQRLLVYEFMPLGSLEDHLHDVPDDREPLNWMTRMKIAAGAARGLAYLHDTANPPVIYRDLKSSNILLDNDYHPKLSDFGLAKLGPVGDKTHVSTRVMGTYGYCAPEYAMTGQLTMKSDVYSFGVVLLELITGRKAIDQTRPSGEHNLVAWARPLFKDRRKFAQMADPKLHGQFPLRGLFQALAVAAMCLHEQAASRPAIADVVTALNFLASHTSEASPIPSKVCLTAPAGDTASTASKPEDTASPQSQDTVDCNGETHAETNGQGENDKNGATNSDKNDGKEAEVQAPAARPAWKTPIKGKDREQAVAEARIWGEAWREKRGGSRREGEEKPSQTS